MQQTQPKRLPSKQRSSGCSKRAEWWRTTRGCPSFLPQRKLSPDVWEQVQIRRAIALGLGARGPYEIELRTADLAGSADTFTALVADICRYTGLTANDVTGSSHPD